MKQQLNHSEIRERKRYTIFDVRYLWSIFKNHKRWFVLSLLVCLLLALLYVYLSHPAYSVRARMVIVERRSNSGSNALAMLQGQLPFGLGSNLNVNLGVENEKEILHSRLIARDVVNDLGLHTEYRLKGFLKKRLVYKDQPVSVVVSSEMLQFFDEELPLRRHRIDMSIEKNNDGYQVEVTLRENNKKIKLPVQMFKSLPAVIHTNMGDLNLKENLLLNAEQKNKYEKDYELDVRITPPMTTARRFAKITSIASVSKKAVYTINLDIQDENILRGIDYLNGLIKFYNEYTNQVKREEVEKSDEFVNSRLAKMEIELDSADARWTNSKKRFQVTDAKVDAEEVMKKKSTYESQIVNIGIQQQMLDYLEEYVNDPTNQYELIPVNMTGNVRDSIPLIGRYNQIVSERNKMLKSLTEQSAQVRQNKQLLDELQSAILTALQREKETLLMRKRVVEGEYNRYMGRVGNVPDQERVLTEIGRDRNVKQGVYVSLLQKREENAIELANTTDKGRKIDETLFQKKTKPKVFAVLGLAVILSLLMPYVVFFMYRSLKRRIDSEIDLKLQTNCPLMGSVSSKPDECEESFRRIRTNLLHQMKEGHKAVLVTSAEECDGKTFCAIRLAEAFARMGEKTVICDLNLRHPSVTEKLDVKEQPGLSSWLHNKETGEIRLFVKDTKTPGLTVLPAGTDNTIHPADLIAHKSLHHILACLKQEYDVVILDSPALGRYDDILIDGIADVTCYVCCIGKTRKSDIENLDKLTKENRLASPCVVLNQMS